MYLLYKKGYLIENGLEKETILFMWFLLDILLRIQTKKWGQLLKYKYIGPLLMDPTQDPLLKDRGGRERLLKCLERSPTGIGEVPRSSFPS